MAHIKVSQMDNDWGYRVSRGQPLSALVKVSSRGLIGKDRQELIERAGGPFAEAIDKLQIKEGQVPVHSIALGAGEFWSANRNGDFWSEQWCRANHPTFTKYARHYRHHQNRDPRKSYGLIKLSAYNEEMKRIELLELLNGNEKIAEENGGLVADKELEKLAKGEDIPGSMAALVAFDSCMACGNKARTRKEYCDERMCKRGGVKRHLGKVCDDGFVMAVDNPDPTWFDYSTVFRPADRIAYGSRASYLEKAAADETLSGSDLAEAWGVGPTPAVMEKMAQWYDRPDLQDQLKIACALARLEPLAERLPTPKDSAFSSTVRERFPVALLGVPGSLKLAASLNWLADNRMVLHIEDFAALVGQPRMAKTAADYLPGVYNRLWRSGELAEKIAEFSLAPPSRVSTPVPCVLKYAEEACSLDAHAVQRRAMRAALRQVSRPAKRKAEHLPEMGTAEEKLAEQYALYKLAALARMAERASSTEDLALTCENAILQNYVQ